MPQVAPMRQDTEAAMRKTGRRVATLVTLGLATGCSSTSQRQPYAGNPLLLSREPLTQTAPAATAKQPGTDFRTPTPPVARTAPPAPPPKPTTSATTVAAAEGPALREVTPPTPPIIPAARTTSPPEPVFSPSPAPAHLPVPPVPAPQAAAPAPLPATVAKARLDHAADYSWLQGELDLHYRGHKELRYCPPSDDDPYGGKVRLVDDPRLAEFQPGDLLRVEGELARDDSGPGGQFPRFHVRSVRLVERRPAKN